MRLYVANYDTSANIEAANDDRDMLQLEWEAGPKVAWTFFHNTEAQLAKMKTYVEEDVLEAYDECDRPFMLEWRVECEPAPEDSNPRYAYSLWGKLPGEEQMEVFGALIVQAVNTDDEP